MSQTYVQITQYSMKREKKVYDKMKNLMKNNGSYSNCLKPCQTISYDALFREMYQNAR